MTHPNEDQLLLHAYAELAELQAAELQRHLAACAECRARFRALAESREAAAWALERPARSRPRRLAWAALPLAAAVGAVLLWRGNGAPEAARPSWQTHLMASPTAGYVTGGEAFITIDSQLVRLEQGRRYGSLD